MLEIAIISFIKIRRPKGTSDSIYQCYFYLSTKNVVDCTHQACYRACLAVYSRNKNIEVLAPLNIPSNSNRSSRISNKLFGFDSLHFHCVLSMCLCMSCPYIVWVYRAHVCLHRKKRESTSYTHTASPKTFCPFLCRIYNKVMHISECVYVNVVSSLIYSLHFTFLRPWCENFKSNEPLIFLRTAIINTIEYTKYANLCVSLEFKPNNIRFHIGIRTWLKLATEAGFLLFIRTSIRDFFR